MTFGTMERIQTVTVPAGGQAAITFSNVPQTYDDLKIVISGRSSSTPAEGMYIAFNGSTSNFTGRYLIGDGTNASSGVLARYVGSIFGAVGTASTFNNTEIYIPNYRTSANKSFSVDNVAENNAATAYANLIAGLWSDSSAITSISITCAGFLQHSTATLYGITRVPAGAKATGGVIYDDSSYWYHVFTSSGTFTPSQSFSADVLVVAGGGSGGRNANGGGQGGCGGGGAGGLLAHTNQSVTSSTNYTVTIGAGGAGGTYSSTGNDGSNSQFGSLTASTGGGGGGRDGGSGAGFAGRNGGSGGGGSYESAAGTGTSGQGFNGGAGRVSPSVSGGGGGGAGEAGNTDAFGEGGDGSSTYSDWGNATGQGQDVSGTRWFAGGGGGGASTGAVGGAGGGGVGSSGTSGAAGNAIANTGGGGGGSGGNTSAGAAGSGGSGIVIVRYAK